MNILLNGMKELEKKKKERMNVEVLKKRISPL
jgi:hypothetical protein